MDIGTNSFLRILKLYLIAWNLYFTYAIKDISPALKGDALEHRQHGQAKVVEVGDAVVWSIPSAVALVARRTLVAHSAGPDVFLVFTYISVCRIRFGLGFMH